MLALTRSLGERQRLAVGMGVLVLFVALSGLEPSVLRAACMGAASWVALAQHRQTRPVGVLLVVAVALLVINPLWIWHLGFQFSFLATLGLIITVPLLMPCLDGLPPAIAALLAVPLAATLWTLPLQLATFGVVPAYSVLANVLATPLLILLVVGGFISALAALVWPLAGSALAWVLYYPCQALLALVLNLNQWPGQTLTLGRINPVQLLLLYGILLSVWLWPWARQQWRWGAVLVGVVLVVPLWHLQTQRFQVTVFHQPRMPVMVVQQPGATILLNSGDAAMATQSLLPFLRQQGIARIDWAIATDWRPDTQRAWEALSQQIPIQAFSAIAPTPPDSLQHLAAEQPPLPLQAVTTVGQFQIQVLRQRPAALWITLDQQSWLILTHDTRKDTAAWLQTAPLPDTQILWWTGQAAPPRLNSRLQPQTLILSTPSPVAPAIESSQNPPPQVYRTQQVGTLVWTPQDGFNPTLDPADQIAELS